MANKTPAGYWSFDVNAYLKLVAKGTRWDQLPDNTGYPASKAVLVTPTTCVVQLRRIYYRRRLIASADEVVLLAA